MSADGLEAAVERLLALDEYDEKQRELGAARVKRNVLEVEKTDAELADSPAFERLEARIERLESELDALESDYADLPDRV